MTSGLTHDLRKLHSWLKLSMLVRLASLTLLLHALTQMLETLSLRLHEALVKTASPPLGFHSPLETLLVLLLSLALQQLKLFVLIPLE